LSALRRVDAAAARLNPYFLWVIFAGYLNLALWLLSR
jgi:tryptophan-rich sensory protein